MIVDIFGSLKENLNKKVRNPFFGTLSIVFVLQNWQLFYSLLFFDKIENRLTRIETLETYIANAGGPSYMFIKAVGCSFGVLIISYLLLNISSLISNYSDAVIHPFVVKLATKGQKVVTKEKYENLNEKYKRLEISRDEEMQKRYSAEERAESCERKYSQLQIDQDNSDLNQKIIQLEADLEEEKKMRAELEDQISNHSNEEKNNLPEKSREEKIVDRILENEEWKEDFKIIIRVSNEATITARIMNEINTSLKGYLLFQEVLERQSSGIYTFTAFGRLVKGIFINHMA